MATNDTAVHMAAASPTVWGDGQLAAELRVGSVEAFNALIALYHQPLFRFLSRMLGDADAAADTVQEVFLKVFRSAAGFEGKSSVKTWLYQIAVHEASNQRRWWRRHKRQEISFDAPAREVAKGSDSSSWGDLLPDRRESPLAETLRHEQQREVQAALSRVPEPFHQVLVLREIEGFSYDEIAEILHVRVGTIKSRLVRGREMLRQAWQANLGQAQALAGMHGRAGGVR